MARRLSYLTIIPTILHDALVGPRFAIILLKRRWASIQMPASEELFYEITVNPEWLEVDFLEFDATLRTVLEPFQQNMPIPITFISDGGRARVFTLDYRQSGIVGKGLGQWIRKMNALWLGFSVVSADPLTCRLVPLEPSPPITTSASSSWELAEFEELVKSFPASPALSLPYQTVGLRDTALELALTPGFDRLLAPDVVRGVEPFDYQRRTVTKVLQQMRGRALLCDEVGLGKTVEAGLIALEYFLRGLVQRILVLTPPSLVSQWKEEMERKFNLSFVSHEDPAFRQSENPFHEIPLLIVSIDTAKRPGWSEKLLSASYDLIIVDEAHHVRNPQTLAYRLINNLSKKYLLLLTATPVENRLDDLFHLITLLAPGQLQTQSTFRRQFGGGKEGLLPKNTETLRRLLSRVMIRNKRSNTGVITTKRTAVTLECELNARERQFYDDVTQFVRDRYRSNFSGQRGSSPVLTPFTLKVLQKELGSSPLASLPTLLKLADHDGVSAAIQAQLLRFAQQARELGHGAKFVVLTGLLKHLPSEKVVIFTGFRDTQKSLVDYLQQEGIPCASFHGGMKRQDKEDAIRHFQDAVPVLVSTESGGEGRNLQFCHVMVNFDLPWNPLRIEQRIGRLHRIGQQENVRIYNLSAADTIEAEVLTLLDAKINLFELVVGELDMILGRLTKPADFEDMVMETVMAAQDSHDLKQRMDALGEELREAKKHYDQVKHLDENLFERLVADDA